MCGRFTLTTCEVDDVAPHEEVPETLEHRSLPSGVPADPPERMVERARILGPKTVAYMTTDHLGSAIATRRNDQCWSIA